MTRLNRSLVAGTMAALALGTALATAGTAAADPVSIAANCRSWSATDTAGDIVGAHAYGEKCELDSGRVQIDATIKDTKSDGEAACVQLHATYADGGTRDEWLYVGGYGETKSKSFTYASSVRTIWVREGRGNDGSCKVMANGVYTIWS